MLHAGMPSRLTAEPPTRTGGSLTISISSAYRIGPPSTDGSPRPMTPPDVPPDQAARR
jgi:hypothetical protein